MPTLGVLIGLPIAGVLTLIGAALIFVGFWMRKEIGNGWHAEHDYDAIAPWGPFAGGVVLIIATLLITGIAMWPWSAEYHAWRPVSGVVTATGTRLLGGDNSTSQYYAEQINGQTYRCDDTRCSTVKVGDWLSLTCKREWQFAGIPGWDCNFVSANTKH